jgi:hypothetical protein
VVTVVICVLICTPEDGSRSTFRKAGFRYFEFRTMERVEKPSDSECMKVFCPASFILIMILISFCQTVLHCTPDDGQLGQNKQRMYVINSEEICATVAHKRMKCSESQILDSSWIQIFPSLHTRDINFVIRWRSVVQFLVRWVYT